MKLSIQRKSFSLIKHQHSSVNSLRICFSHCHSMAQYEHIVLKLLNSIFFFNFRIPPSEAIYDCKEETQRELRRQWRLQQERKQEKLSAAKIRPTGSRQSRHSLDGNRTNWHFSPGHGYFVHICRKIEKGNIHD